MAHDSGVWFVVLHTLRVRHLSSIEQLADATCLEPSAVEVVLGELAATGLADHREGVRPGWLLTRDGRAHHVEAVGGDLSASGAVERVEAAYRRFLDLNPDVLAVCAAWQLRDDGSNLLNDHEDASYDARVVGRLVELHDRSVPVIDALASALTRFACYGARLRRAITHVVAGDLDWFTRPTLDSFHTIWFELHEDLLRTLGIERGSELLGG